MEHWQDLAFRKLKQGKSLAFPWVSKTIPEEVASVIRDRLPACKSQADIERAFDLNMPDTPDRQLRELADALNKAVEAVEVKYSPDQPRVPGGHSDGGQWTDGSGGASQSKLSEFDTFPSPGTGSKLVYINGKLVKYPEGRDHLQTYAHLVLENPEKFDQKMTDWAKRLLDEGKADDSLFEDLVQQKLDAISIETGANNSMTFVKPHIRGVESQMEWNQYLQTIKKMIKKGQIDISKTSNIYLNLDSGHISIPADRIFEVSRVTFHNGNILVHYDE